MYRTNSPAPLSDLYRTASDWADIYSGSHYSTSGQTCCCFLHKADESKEYETCTFKNKHVITSHVNITYTQTCIQLNIHRHKHTEPTFYLLTIPGTLLSQFSTLQCTQMLKSDVLRYPNSIYIHTQMQREIILTLRIPRVLFHIKSYQSAGLSW